MVIYFFIEKYLPNRRLDLYHYLENFLIFHMYILKMLFLDGIFILKLQGIFLYTYLQNYNLYRYIIVILKIIVFIF